MTKKAERPKEIFSFEAIYLRLRKHNSRALFERLKKGGTLAPKITLPLIAAYLFAFFLLLLLLSLGWTGLKWTFGSGVNLVRIFLGIVMLVLFWGLFPKFGKKPKKILSPAKYPNLYKVVSSIRENLAAPALQSISIFPEFSARLLSYGFPQKRHLDLGLPLLSILTPQETVALIGHELAHSVNHDPRRGLIIGSTLDMLYGIHYYFHVDISNAFSSIFGLLTLPFFLVYIVISAIAYAAHFLLVNLFWVESQKSEYLADYLSTQVAGQAATLSLLQKTYLNERFHNLISRVAISKSMDLFKELHQAFQADSIDPKILTSSEEPTRETLRAQEKELYLTHPPAPYRAEFVQLHGEVSPQVKISSADWKALQKELKQLEAGIQETITDRYLTSIS